MSNAGAVVGAIAAHTVITSTIRNQEQEPPVEARRTEEELAKASDDFMADFARKGMWAMGGFVGFMGIIALLIILFG